jgi:glyceraldehyde 3-phosphate dehydrogenase
MVKVGVSAFVHTGSLVTSAFNSSKVDIVSVNQFFFDLNYMLHMVPYDSNHEQFNVSVKTENRKLVINGKSISKPGMVAQICNFSYLGGKKDQEF